MTARCALLHRQRPGQQDSATVFAITDTPDPLSVEQAARTRRYLAAMTLRTAAVIGAIVIPGWPRAVLIAAAVALPYLAVVAANTAGRRRAGRTAVTALDRPALPAAHPAPASGSAPRHAAAT